MPSRVTSRNEMPARPRPTEAPKAPSVRAPERAAPPPPPAPALAAADQNLAEMAQRLEAALRRPAGDAGEPRVGAPPVAPEPPANRGAPRSSEPTVNAPTVQPPAKSGFENLEDEMASLLGRPKTPS
jgi:flagellar protein FliO/FliZ